MDKAIYANDLIHRFASHTFTEAIVGSLTKVTFKDGISATIRERSKLDVIDAYKAIRKDLLDGESPLFLSTTTQRDALTSVDTGTMIDNVTVGRTEIFNGSDWKSAARRSSVTGITASTTQTQGNGLLSGDLNVIATVASVNDTVTLPTAVAGITVIVINAGSKKVKIFPFVGDDLGAGLNSDISLSAGSAIIFHCYDATNWVST